MKGMTSCLCFKIIHFTIKLEFKVNYLIEISFPFLSLHQYLRYPTRRREITMMNQKGDWWQEIATEPLSHLPEPSSYNNPRNGLQDSSLGYVFLFLFCSSILRNGHQNDHYGNFSARSPWSLFAIPLVNCPGNGDWKSILQSPLVTHRITSRSPSRRKMSLLCYNLQTNRRQSNFPVNNPQQLFSSCHRPPTRRTKFVGGR